MASSNSARNVAYDPLPLTGDDMRSGALYNAPPSPEPNVSNFHTPQMVPSELGADESAIPSGAAQPRFLGAALYDAPGPSFRDSFASSQHTIPTSEYTSSVYALNDPAVQGRFDGGYRDDPQDGYYSAEHGGVPMSALPSSSRTMEEKRAAYAPPQAKSRRKFIIIGIVVCILLIVLAVVIPLYLFVLKPSNNGKELSTTSSSSSGTKTASSSASAAKPSASAQPVSGRDGTLITMEDGTTFTYTNPFGGTWYFDENDPFNNNAQAQSWTPPLNSTFNYGTDKIKGVNFGGWLVTEPFISPALYEKYLNASTIAVDEWTLSQNMAADTSAGGGISQLETHYQTFITEQDFAQVAGAGLNHIRIPIGYWAIETRGDEPFLAQVSWTYFLKAIKWARKYGLRINLDLHAMPGSQNGWNHSGRLGTIGFLNGPMGYANAQRGLDYIRIIAEFISQPQYKDVVTIFGFMNEPQASTIGQDALSRFYYQAYEVIRNAGGTGTGNGPYVSMHDAFLPRSSWVDVFPNADRLSIDSHPYICFNAQSSAAMSTYATTPCTTWGSVVNASSSVFGLTNAGEFSNAVTDCGLYLNGVNLGARYDGTFAGNWPSQGSCDTWTSYQSWSTQTKSDIMQFALASMDALQDYFFWTWKIGNSSVTGQIESPAWSYQLGLQQGWMPTDPRTALGTCGNTSPWSPPLAAWQTGGAGAGNIPASATSALAWPPASLSAGGAVSTLPSYTPTGTLVTLPVPTFTSLASTATISAGNGWANPSDTTLMMVGISGCTYLDPWVNPTTAPPAVCPASSRRRDEPAPPSFITPVPQS